jgi:hypothetical protein
MAEATFSLDLHVLGPPLTFALSQDQTLRRKFKIPLYVALVWKRPGDDLHAQRGMVSVRTNTKPTIFKTACYPVFRDRSRRGVPRLREFFLSGLDKFVEGVCL